MTRYRIFILFFCFSFSITRGLAQPEKQAVATTELFPARQNTQKTKTGDSLTKVLPKKDTVAKHIPRIATLRSALVPGWGQAYNKEYWKIPIVYGILAIPVTLYFYNNSYYNKTKFAYEARFKEARGDSTDVAFIDDQLKGLGITSLQNYRNSFRRDRDYSVLWFLLAWGLQVADATVFAHLKDFDVSNDLSMSITPVFNPITRSPGVGLTLNLKNSASRRVISR